jgi:5-oxoprolinase (ATP-hydrolysing)
MTNTRITDAEVFERRYPVVLREFALRAGSGGGGQHPGGDGVVRDIEFRIPLQVSILSERRVYHHHSFTLMRVVQIVDDIATAKICLLACA